MKRATAEACRLTLRAMAASLEGREGAGDTPPECWRQTAGVEDIMCRCVTNRTQDQIIGVQRGGWVGEGGDQTARVEDTMCRCVANRTRDQITGVQQEPVYA